MHNAEHNAAVPNKLLWAKALSSDSCGDGHKRVMVFANADEYASADPDGIVHVRRLTSKQTYPVLKHCLLEPAELEDVEPIQAHAFYDFFLEAGVVRMCQVQGFMSNGDATVCYLAGGEVKQECVRPTRLAACQTHMDEGARRAAAERMRLKVTLVQRVCNSVACDAPPKATQALVVHGTVEQLSNAARLLRSLGMRVALE